MKIAIFRSVYPPWELQPYKEMGSKYRISLFVTSESYGIYSKFVRQNGYNRLPFGRLALATNQSRLLKKALIWRTAALDTDIWPYVLKEILVNDYEVIDVLENYAYSSVQAGVAALLSNRKVAVTSWENIDFPPWRFTLRYLVDKTASKFRAMSYSAAQRLIKEGISPVKIAVIPPALDTGNFSTYKSERLKDELGIKNKIVILFVGRLIQQKGVIQLLNAFLRLDRRDAVLLYAGDGPLASALLQQAKMSRLKENVKLLGAIPYDKINEIHSVADITVLPSIPTSSWQEQFGFAIAEAMASGKAVIASKVGSLPELITHRKNGLLITPGSVEELYKAIYELLSDEGLRKSLGNSAREHIQKNFSIKVISTRLRQFYDEL